MMLAVLVVVSVVATLSTAIVCPPEFCAYLVTQPPLNCKGSVIKNAGPCGCIDVCARVEGEICHAWHFFEIPTLPCDKGLTCVSQHDVGPGLGICVRSEPDKRASP